jgi:hypothetical protein
MNDPYTPPTPPPPPAPQPFQPEQAGALGGPGCGKPIAIGCMLLLILLGAFGVFVASQQEALLAWSIGAMQEPLERQLAEDVTAADRARLATAFDAARAAARAETVDPAKLQRLQRKFLEVAGKPKVAREELLSFLTVLEDFAGSPSAPEAPTIGAPEAPTIGAPEATP